MTNVSESLNWNDSGYGGQGPLSNSTEFVLLVEEEGGDQDVEHK